MPGFGFFGGFTGGGGTTTAPDPGGTGPFGTLPATVERLYDGHNLWFDTRNQQARETIEFWVSADDYQATIDQLIGVPTSYSTVWGGSVIRRLPMEHPTKPGMFAVQATVTGRGRTSATSLYASYLFRVDFETFPYQTTGDTPFMSIRREFSSTALTRKGRYLYHEGTGETLNIDMPKHIPQVSYLLTIFGISATNHAAIAAASEAPVNSATLYLPDGLIVDPGFALFQGVADEVNFSFQGFVSKAVTYRIYARSGVPFGYMYSNRTGVLDRVVDAAGNPLNDRSDLNLLWL